MRFTSPTLSYTKISLLNSTNTHTNWSMNLFLGLWPLIQTFSPLSSSTSTSSKFKIATKKPWSRRILIFEFSGDSTLSLQSTRKLFFIGWAKQSRETWPKVWPETTKVIECCNMMTSRFPMLCRWVTLKKWGEQLAGTKRLCVGQYLKQ